MKKPKKVKTPASHCIQCQSQLFFLTSNKIPGREEWKCQKCSYVNPVDKLAIKLVYVSVDSLQN